jgi:hypothetical protein
MIKKEIGSSLKDYTAGLCVLLMRHKLRCILMHNCARNCIFFSNASVTMISIHYIGASPHFFSLPPLNRWVRISPMSPK